MESMVINRLCRNSDSVCLGALCKGGACMNQMTVNEGCILHHLKNHSGLKSVEVAEDLERSITEVESDLNNLRAQGFAEEDYAIEVGYVWRAIV